ncbi:MAG: Gfo/Idh/MocA family oxidoreductase [Planctomycetes bacterium]|nr:Gfo/Idh/MocA family oxidoreductase [Planctomycetota bacterium]
MKKLEPQKKLRVGVIGLGMGENHVKGYIEHPMADVVAIADPDEKRLADIGDRHRIGRRYASAEQMLTDEALDVVSNASPNRFHKTLTIAAFEAGCHVLCEKPMAMNAAEGREMLEASMKANKRLMIDYSWRFTEQAMALKRQVETGMFGEFYFGRTVWHRRRGIPPFALKGNQKEILGGGPMIDLGVHRLDLALWLMGFPKPVSVMAGAYNAIGTAIAKHHGVDYDIEDLAAAFIRFENGATLAVEASWAANIAENELMETRLLGTKGGLVQRNVREGYEFEAEIYVEHAGAQFDMKLHPPMPGVRSAYWHFVDSIVNNQPHISTGQEGVMAMEILDAIYESAQTGRPVALGASRQVREDA